MHFWNGRNWNPRKPSSKFATILSIGLLPYKYFHSKFSCATLLAYSRKKTKMIVKINSFCAALYLFPRTTRTIRACLAEGTILDRMTTWKWRSMVVRNAVRKLVCDSCWNRSVWRKPGFWFKLNYLFHASITLLHHNRLQFYGTVCNSRLTQ